jgi:hypothetical protein
MGQLLLPVMAAAAEKIMPGVSLVTGPEGGLVIVHGPTLWRLLRVDATLLTLVFLAVLVSRATALPGCRRARWTWIGPRRVKTIRRKLVELAEPAKPES